MKYNLLGAVGVVIVW